MNICYLIKLCVHSFATVGISATVVRIISTLLDFVLTPLYSHKPIVENQILFMSEPDYSDNSRVLYEYIVEKNLSEKYEIIWLVTNKVSYSCLRKRGLKCVYRHSIFPSNGMHRATYYYTTSKWIFHTHGHLISKKLQKPNQIIVSLWHGGMGFKQSKGAVNAEIYPSTYTLISGDGEITKKVALVFHNCSPDSLLPLGLPRNDLLFKWKEISSFDSIQGTKILWMPTFRQAASSYISDVTLNSQTGLPILITPNHVNQLSDYLTQKNIHLFIKVHPLQKREAIMDISLSNIHLIDNSDIENQQLQLYEIFNHYDALITDYSSVSFDYLYLDKPIGYTLDDFDEYSNSRGFSMSNPLNYMPGHHIYTYNDFVGFIQDISSGNDKYKDERERVRKDVGLPKGGECCQMILEFLDII